MHGFDASQMLDHFKVALGESRSDETYQPRLPIAAQANYLVFYELLGGGELGADARFCQTSHCEQTYQYGPERPTQRRRVLVMACWPENH